MALSNQLEEALTWTELEAKGVLRCCVSFRGGKRCARRVAKGSRDWCAKHQDMMGHVEKKAVAVIKTAAKSGSQG